MKKSFLFLALALLPGSLLAADATPKDDLKGAAKKLAEKGNYSWKATTENAGGGGGGGGGRGFGGGPVDGKTDKDAGTSVSMARRDTTTDAVLKGGKAVIKTDEGWKLASELAEGDGQNPLRFTAMRVQNLKVPAAEAEELVGRVKELKKEGETYSGDLTEEGAKALLSFRGGRGGGGGDTSVSNAKGTAKFWVKEGVLTKYQYNVKGSVSFGGNDRDVDRTTTVEIKDVGTTKVQVPDEAKKKLS